MLEGMGVTINCRFLGDATAEELRNLTAAPLNILAVDAPDNRKLRAWLEEKYSLTFYDGFLPVGNRETSEFLRNIAGFFGRPEAAEDVIAREKARYDAEAARLRRVLKGKKVIMTTINANLDWLLDAAEDVGLEFVWIGVLNYLRQEIKISDRPERQAAVEEIGAFFSIRDRIRDLHPDIVISNYTAATDEGDYIVDNLPMGQLNGFRSGLEVMDRWARLLQTRREGEWMHDRALFEKYFA
jgi:nitrogenase molybdenum-iron protein alpha/beta subunit